MMEEWKTMEQYNKKKTTTITSLRLALELVRDEKCFLALKAVRPNNKRLDRNVWIFEDSDYLQLVLHIAMDKYNIRIKNNEKEKEEI